SFTCNHITQSRVRIIPRSLMSDQITFGQLLDDDRFFRHDYSVALRSDLQSFFPLFGTDGVPNVRQLPLAAEGSNSLRSMRERSIPRLRGKSPNPDARHERASGAFPQARLLSRLQLVHTGQHHDECMSGSFFRGLNIVRMSTGSN